jgi:hypothetical protein
LSKSNQIKPNQTTNPSNTETTIIQNAQSKEVTTDTSSSSLKGKAD